MLTDEQIAAVAHDANRGYCAAIGDYTQVLWVNAPDWQRESAILGVRNLREHPDAPPSASHDCWLSHKEAEGWRYGPVKDVDKKEHPCCVPYDLLPPAQRVKDALFVAVVRALLTSPMEMT